MEIKGLTKWFLKNFGIPLKTLFRTSFKEGKFKEGIINGILMAGEELKAHFPWKPDDTNELSNEVSKGLVLFLFFLSGSTVFAQFAIPEKPKLQTSVYDYYGLVIQFG